MSKNFYITTPIYYVNDKPHIGHAYTTVACDVMARFKRLDGYRVKFLTGTDEHGMKIFKAAQTAGITPQELTDRVSVNFREMNKMMDISNDQFIRTTDPVHKSAVQEMWKKMAAAGDIYLDKYAGWYSVRDEAFYGEDELTTDPKGTKIAPTGAPCEWVEEESYFFKLSSWGDRLLKFYEDNPDFIQPHYRRNEVISFVKSGLRDLSISRTTFDWGVKVPNDEKHVMYVWVDALTNYISALGYPDTTTEEYKAFWPADVHIMGKDILRFHAVYWPAFLMSAGLATPKMVFAHGWWMAEGQKMSKSIGNVISPEYLVEKYGVEASRYFMMREVIFGNDGDFSNAGLINRVNAELSNNIGNLVQRTLSQINKNCGGLVPTSGDLAPEDQTLLHICGTALLEKSRSECDKLQFSKYIEEIVQAANAANLYIDAQAPWTLKKTDTKRMETVLYVLAESIRNIALMLQPVTRMAAGKILDQLSVAENERNFSYVGTGHALKPGIVLPAPQGVFPRFMDGDSNAKGCRQVMLIDSHCHLDFDDFAEEGVANIVARAVSSGVRHMVTICTRVAEFDRIKNIAEQFDEVDCTVGTHPHNADEDFEKTITAKDLVDLSRHPKVVGLGETGLDYFYKLASPDNQHRGFREHIKASLETNLPLVIHTRDADEDTMRILREECAGQKLKAVLHCFTSSRLLAEQALEMGLYISFSGIVTFKNAQDLRDIARDVPLDKILVETNFPYLAPVPMRGKRNEPSFVVHTAKLIAELKGISDEKIAQATTENFYRLFDRAREVPM